MCQDRDDLAVTEHRTIRGHGAYLALLDTLDDVFVAALGLRELRTSARMTAAILVAKAAGGCEHFPAFNVVRRGFGLRQRICSARRRGLLGKRGGRQPWPDDGQGSNNHNKRYSHSGIRIHRDVLTGKGGREIDPRRPRHRHCLSAKTTSAPVFFGMLLKGSP